MAHLYVGLSGYSYKPWQGADRFYPETLKPKDFLAYYATRYRAVELDGTWYRMPSEQAVRAWAEQTPPNFIFAPKAHRHHLLAALLLNNMSASAKLDDRSARFLGAPDTGAVLHHATNFGL